MLIYMDTDRELIDYIERVEDDNTGYYDDDYDEYEEDKWSY